MCFKNNVGVELDFTNSYDKKLRDDEFLFSESTGRFIIETNPKNYDKILNLAKKFDVCVYKIGVLIPDPKIYIKGLRSQDFTLNISKLKENHEATIPNLMGI